MYIFYIGKTECGNYLSQGSNLKQKTTDVNDFLLERRKKIKIAFV